MQRNRSSSLSRPGNIPLGRSRSSSVGSRISQGSFARRGTGSFLEQDKCIKDTRPLADKDYQLNCTRKLMDFLMKNGYPSAINKRVLVAPFPSDVHRIFQFIYSFLHPNFKLSTKSPAEDIIKILKCLQYPFTLRKSSLQNTGSGRHSSGEVLAMLVWLMEVVELYFHGSQTIEEGGFFKNVYFEAIGKSFKQFVDTGKSDDDDLIKAFEKIVGLDEAIEKHAKNEEELHEAERQLKELEMEENKLQSEVQLEQQWKEDMHVLEKYIEDMNMYIPHKEAEYENLVVKLEELSQKRQSLQEECEQLKQVLQQQTEKGLSHKTIATIRSEKLETLNLKSDQLQEIQKQCWDKEMEQSQLHHKVAQKFRGINKNLNAAFVGWNLPAEFASLKEFEASFPGTSAAQLEDVKNKLQALCLSTQEETMALENKIFKQKEYVMELEHQINKFEVENKQIEKEIEDDIAKHEIFKNETTAECESLSAENQALMERIADLQKKTHSLDSEHCSLDRLKIRMQELVLQVEEAKVEKEKAIKRIEEEKQDAIESLERVCRPLQEKLHKLIQELLQESD